ncbi:hypothetical protein K491DRAFT_75781 [Lophiostoma macrostomum CBS 122681]|uniref:DUF676 domain-containing protein n=1 Tax=Lophiostoma macrostomum CBS 122681 TaxID=1314788 RepID=A0A6A6SZ54_9PLEO|nr:hypothetical protein K491DRAFT_75781 [Lophiostoma macrostomum CBS 122681]
MAASKNFLEELVPGNDPEVDIVAVHGLNPKGTDAHAYKTWMSEGKIWLRDFLPAQIPNARILLFGYNSNVTNGANLMSVGDHAGNLLERLDFKRGNDPDRPIVFVAHSLGGLVVKKALVDAKLNDAYARIRSATHGIAFFATPHMGGNYAAFMKIVSKIVNHVARNSPNTLVEDLQKPSGPYGFIAKLNEDFQHQLEDYYFVNFFESNYTAGFDVIVDRESATMMLPGSRQIVVPVDANHSQICKFAKKDSIYEQVEGRIAKLAKDAVMERRRRHRTPSLSSTPRLNRERTTSSPALMLDGSPDFDKVAEVERSIFQVPYNRNPDFSGRNDLLDLIAHKLPPDNSQDRQRIALHGFGGVGKTEIALQCAYALQETQPEIAILWIQANSLESSHQSVSRIATALKIEGVETTNADVLGLVRERLLQPDPKWLMIVDQADGFHNPAIGEVEASKPYAQYRRLLQYIPDCPHGSVLVTTRDKKIANSFAKPADIEQILPLRPDESEDLMRRLLPREQGLGGAIVELTDRLNHFPLAIVQACSLMSGNGMSIHTYLQHYRESQSNALALFEHDHTDLSGGADYGNAVTTTWMISFQHLEARNEYASDLISFMAYVNPTDIPGDLLRMVKEDIDKARFDVACGDLKALSFISAAPPDMFNIQPVVQSVMRMWLQRNDKFQHWSDIALTTMANALPAPTISKSSWSSYERLVPHAQTLLEHASVVSNVEIHRADLLYKLAWYFRVRGDHEIAESLGAEALEIRTRVLGDTNEATLAAVHGLSLIIFEKGNVQQAETLQMTALETCKQALGEEHAVTLRSQGHLAAIRGTQKRYDEALLLQEKLLEVTERTFPDSPETWSAMRDLAITYCYLDRQPEAARLQQAVFASRQHHLGENHPETLTIMTDLATTYTEQERFEEAEWLLTKLLERSNRVLGYQHPHTRAAYTRLKNVLIMQNKMNEVNRLDRIIGQIQLRRRQSRMQARGYRRPSAKRNISDSVVTYSYERQLSSSITMNRFPSGATTRSKEVGLGLDMVHLSRDEEKDSGEFEKEPVEENEHEEGEEEGDDDQADEDAEEFATVKLGLRLMMRSMMTLPMINIVLVEPNDHAVEESTTVSPTKEGTRSSDTLSPDPAGSQGRSAVGYRKSPGKSPVNLQRPSYSNSKFIRTVEKKIDRNIDMEAGAELWKSGRGLSKDLAANTMMAVKSVKLPWKPKSSQIKEEDGTEDAPEDATEQSSEDLSKALVTTTDAVAIAKPEETEDGEEGEQNPGKKKGNRKSVLGIKF